MMLLPWCALLRVDVDARRALLFARQRASFRHVYYVDFSLPMMADIFMLMLACALCRYAAAIRR